MRLESTLTLKRAREVPEVDEPEPEQREQEAHIKGVLKQFNNFSELLRQDSLKKKKGSLDKKTQRTRVSGEDERRFCQLDGELRFNGTELITVWSRNKPALNETSDDKLDRLSKVVGTLKSRYVGTQRMRGRSTSRRG